MRSFLSYILDNYFVYYLICINALTFLLYGIDKRKAINKKWRIGERTLLNLPYIGGGLGGLLGMLTFRHKTKKVSFYIINILGIFLYTYILFAI